MYDIICLSGILCSLKCCIPYFPNLIFSGKYAVMYYGNNSCIGIRQKFGDKKQIMSFGGKRAGHSESALRSWADDVLRKLDAGQTPKLVKELVLATSSPEM